MFYKQTVRNINRIRKVAEILIRYGFQEVIVTTPLRKVVPPRQQLAWTLQDRPVFEYTRYERIRMIIEELGPTFIKLAQMLSNRPDVLPEGLILEFQKLQSNVPPFDATVARQIIEAETKLPIDDLFEFFEEYPLGSASIGQVHRARLRTGEDVVVKVQRPGVREKVQTDLILLREFVRQTENYFLNLGILNPLEIVDAFDKSMQQELDYTIEARNTEQFRVVYSHESGLQIPRPFRHLSTQKVMVSEFVGGCKITDIDQLRAWNLDPTEVAERGTDLYLTQMFERGLFHADPHPGNVLVRPDGTIVLIDFGMVGKLMKPQKFAFAGVFVSIARRDAKGLATSLRRLAVSSEIPDTRAFEYDLDVFIEDFVVLDVGDITMSDFTARLQKLIYKYRLEVPGSVFLLLRALAILEGIATQLHPQLDLLARIRPFGARMVAEQYSTQNIIREVEYTLAQLSSLLYAFPGDFRYILKRIREGTFHVNVDIAGYQDFLRSLDTFVNKLIIALIAGALLLGSAITLTVPAPPGANAILGLPYVSLVGFSLAGALIIFLFIYTLRSRR